MKIALPSVIAALLAGILLAWLAAWQPFAAPRSPSEHGFFDIPLAASADGTLDVEIDDGHGFDTENSAHADFRASAAPVALSIPLNPGRINALRAVISCPVAAIGEARIRTSGGELLVVVANSQIVPGAATEGNETGPLLQLKSKGGLDPLQFDVLLREPVRVRTGNEPGAIRFTLEIVLFAVLSLLLVGAVARGGNSPWRAAARRNLRELICLVNARPALSLLGASILATLGSCFPIVFEGRSFVSPNNSARLLYAAYPTLPGIPYEPPIDPKDSDIAAMMLAHLPYSVIESRTLLRDHGIPLWNRYNSCGVTLLGQGQSMLGDPLHLLPLLSDGAYWAWDLKFLLARALFCFGVGLCAYALTKNLPVSMLIAASSAWIGFFHFRFNHPAIFSFCYSPWLLLPWLKCRDAASLRAALPWAALLTLADFAELNSGTAKEAGIAILCLNIAGLLVLLMSRTVAASKLQKIALCAWASILFLLLSAPCWLVFLDCLRQSVTTYDHSAPLQLNPSLFIAYFDELFAQDMIQMEHHILPSANFLVLTGCLWAAASWRRRVRHDSALPALAAAACLPLVFVCGIVPPAVILTIPFLSRIQHIHNTFGCPLIVLMLMIAACGLNACAAWSATKEWKDDWKRMAIYLALLFALYFGFTQAMRPSTLLLYNVTPHEPSRFFSWYAVALGCAGLLLPWGIRWIRQSGAARPAGFVLCAICLFAMHFRHGIYTETELGDYVMTTRSAGNLDAASPAVDSLKDRMSDPFRVSGLGGTLTPGYNDIVGLEGISGPDAVINPWYRELYIAAGIERIYDWRLVIHGESLPTLKPIYDFLNLRYYVREAQRNEPIPPQLAYVGESDLRILESKEAWPRAFFVDSAASCSSPEALVSMIEAGDGHPFAAVQSAPGSPPSPPAPQRRIVPARDYKLTGNKTAFTISAPAAGVVVLNEAYEAANFQATANGKPLPYFRVNHTFKGIYLPEAGEYRVVFSYWPRLLTLGLWLMAAGAALGLGSVIALRRL